MNRIPIVFAFDNNLILAASICIFSLLHNAKNDTFYDIFILYPENENLRVEPFEKLTIQFPNCSITFRKVRNVFDLSYQIRGINTVTYYRLLIPEMIPEYDKIIYSDVDVIFREDLSDIYNETNIDDYYFAGVNSLSHLNPDRKKYYEGEIFLPSDKIYYAGNIIINSKKIKNDDLIPQFILNADKKYKFQDLDILNIVCKDKIKSIPPKFCLTTDISEQVNLNPTILSFLWSDEELKYALVHGIVHYNGQKPWKGYCINFDIWWEYYRKSPFFDPRFYFKFFYNKLDEYDSLPLIKRIKILLRYFVYGKKKPV